MANSGELWPESKTAFLLEAVPILIFFCIFGQHKVMDIEKESAHFRVSQRKFSFYNSIDHGWSHTLNVDFNPHFFVWD